MASRITVAALLLAGVLGVGVCASGPFSGSWETEILASPGNSFFFESLSSALSLIHI